jgi:hypothetical protein
MNIITQDTLLLNSLDKFYKNEQHFQTFTSIIKKQSIISLRIIDWFVTKYTKENNTWYMHNNKPFYVHLEYKNKLKGLNKQRFDSCKRKYNKDNVSFLFKETVETTVGQLNYFRWAIDNGIIDYIEKNYVKLNNILNTKQKHENGITTITVKFR